MKSCDTALLRTGHVVRKPYLEIPTADCAVCRASSEVVSYHGETEDNREVVMPSSASEKILQ